MRTVIWAVILGIAVTQKAASSDLPSDVDDTTADGQIGRELEIVNINVALLTEQIADSAQDINDAYNNTSQFTFQAETLLIDSQLLTWQQELKETEALIASIQVEMNDALHTCPAANSCSACIKQASCVWCSVEKMCVAGDQNGPRNAECSVFSSGQCEGGCGQYGACEVCVADPLCGWCRETARCEAGSATDPAFCDPNQWLFEISQYSLSCPVDSPQASSWLPVDDPLVNTEQNKLQRQLRIHSQKAANLHQAISSLRAELERLTIDIRSDSDAIVADSNLDTSSLAGLHIMIDVKVLEEIAEFVNRTAEIGEEIEEREGEEVMENLDEDISDRIEQEDELLAAVTNSIQDLVDETIENQKKAEKAAEEAKKAQEDAEKAAKEAAEKAEEKSASFLQVSELLPI